MSKFNSTSSTRFIFTSTSFYNNHTVKETNTSAHRLRNDTLVFRRIHYSFTFTPS